MPHKDLEARKAYRRNYYYNGPGREKHAAYHLALKLAAFEAYGGARCLKCGFSDHRALNLDHINGGGSIQRRESPSNTIYLLLKREGYPAGFQVLCANCNSIKKHTNREFTGPKRKNGSPTIAGS